MKQRYIVITEIDRLSIFREDAPKLIDKVALIIDDTNYKSCPSYYSDSNIKEHFVRRSTRDKGWYDGWVKIFGVVNWCNKTDWFYLDYFKFKDIPTDKAKERILIQEI